MIQLQKVHLQLGTKVLFEGADLSIYPGQKWGIIGTNGSGKSSLFKLLLREIHEDQGESIVPSQWSFAHMRQELHTSSRTALDYVIDGDGPLRQIQKQIGETDGERLGRLYEQLEQIDGYSAEARAQQLLNGLGFAHSDVQRPVHEFSGGWRIRLNLAQALMCRSDCLLLDEPTNHLDLDASIWLERWLQNYTGTLLIISHDRDFLDAVVDNVAAIEGNKIACYSGNYSAYERQKAERLAQQHVAFEKQQARIAEIENFVRRFRAKATKAKQAQSRLKELERMEIIAPAHVDSPFSFAFPAADKTPDLLLNIRNAFIGYGSTATLGEVNLSLHATTRIGLLGRNGAGKSTLMKALAGTLPMLSGSRTAHERLALGYFSQHQFELLDLQASCVLHLQRLTPRVTEQDIRNFLGGFGFSGDRVFEDIAHFSGGEKARLALALVAWQKPNLLLLDEPTNHLDIEMCHALTIALQNFSGAVVIISHDRHLLKNTVDEFLLVNDGGVDSFDGDLPDYQQNLLQQEVHTALGESNKGAAGDKKQRRQAAAALREKLKPLTKELTALEKKIDATQRELDVIEKQLADPSIYDQAGDALTNLVKNQAQLRQNLVQYEESWLETSELLEQLGAS